MRRWVEFDADGMPVRGTDDAGREIVDPPMRTRALAAMVRPSPPELLSRLVSEEAVADLPPGGFVLVEHRRDGSWRFTTDMEGDTTAVAFADRVEHDPEPGVPSTVEMTVLLNGEPLGTWSRRPE